MQQRSINWSIGCLLHSQTRDQTLNLGMCPDRESNQANFLLWDNAPTNWVTPTRASKGHNFNISVTAMWNRILQWRACCLDARPQSIWTHTTPEYVLQKKWEKLVSAPGLSPGRSKQMGMNMRMVCQTLPVLSNQSRWKEGMEGKKSVCEVGQSIRRRCVFLFYIILAEILKLRPTETLS